jgi:SulP family sulfate permease
VLVLLFLRPLLAEFPLPALGAIVIFAAVHLIDVDAFRRMGRLRHSEQVLALSAFVGVLAFDIVYGVLIAVVLSVLDLFRRVARPHDAVLGTVPGLAGLHDVDDFPDAHTIRGLVIYRYDAFLCFANADDFRTRALAAVDGEPERVEWLVLNMEANVEVDVTATDALWLLRSQLEQRNIRLGLARVKQDLFAQLEPVGLVDAIGCDMIFPTLPTVLEAFAAREGGPVDDGG